MEPITFECAKCDLTISGTMRPVIDLSTAHLRDEHGVSAAGEDK